MNNVLKLKMGISDVKVLHAAISYYLEHWPEGTDLKPAEEKAHLLKMKSMFDAMLLEYNFHHN